MKKLLITAVLLLAVLAACSPTKETALPATEEQPIEAVSATEISTAEPKPTEAVSETSPGFPTGRFVSIHDASKISQYFEDGSFAFYVASKNPVVKGTYTVDGRIISIVNPKETDSTCMDPGTYEWFFDGNQLTFAPYGEDTCRPRREAQADTYIMDTSSMPEITVDAADFSYSAPESVSEGWVRVTLTNSGTEPHHVQIMRLNDGVTLEQFQEALKQGEGPALALVQQMGGVGAIAPTGTAQAVLKLPAGEYVLMCFVPSPSDNVPHLAKGMVKSLTVQEDAISFLDEPKPSLTIHLQDYSFDMPDSLPAGVSVIKVINDGPEPHEFNILKLAEGKTLADVQQFLAGAGGPPPFTPAGGMNGLDKGLVGYAEINLETGNYVAICNIPSPNAAGNPHFALGMIKEFSVGSTGLETGQIIAQ